MQLPLCFEERVKGVDENLLEFIAQYWLAAAFAALLAAFCRMYNRQNAVEDGIQALLRSEIIGVYNHYCPKEFIPIYALENVEEMYKQYHILGGNGAVTKLVEDLRELPTAIDTNPPREGSREAN